MSFTDVTAGGTDAFGLAIEYDPNGLINAPSAPVPTTATTGGTVLAGVYQVEVSYTSALGETTASASGSVTTTGSTSTITVPSPSAETGATDWYAYVTQVGGSTYTRQQTAGSPTAIGTALTLTAPPTNTGAAPPASNATTGTAGVPIAPTTFIPVTEMGLKAPWTFVEPELMRGTLLSHAVMERQYIDPQGPVSWLLNSALGIEFLQLTLGAKASLIAVTANTTAGNTTANGVTTLTVTGTYEVGSMVDIGTGASMERRQIMSYAAGTMTVGALKINATAASGVAVSQKACTKYANSLLPSTMRSQLPTATGEVIHGDGLWSLQYPWLYANALSLEFGEKGVTGKIDFVGCQEHNLGNSAGTSPATFTSSIYNPDATKEAIALRPLTAIDSHIVALGDPDATGTSVVRAALGVESLKIDYKNDLEKKALFNDSTAYMYFPSGKATCAFSFNEVQTSKRPDIWYDAIKTSVASPFFAGAWKNLGTLSSPVYHGVAIYSPTFRYNQQDDTMKSGSVDMWAKGGKALAPAGSASDYLVIYTQ